MRRPSSGFRPNPADRQRQNRGRRVLASDQVLIDDGEIKISIGKIGARGATIDDPHFEGGGIEIYQTLSVWTYDCEMTYSWHLRLPS